MSGRSLTFKLMDKPPFYDALIEVRGGVTGVKYGELLLARADMKELRDILDSRLAEDPTPAG